MQPSKKNLSLILLVEIILIFGLIIFSYKNAMPQEFPLYPEERQYTLNVYEIGVKTEIRTNASVSFDFINEVKDNMKTSLTKGVFVIDYAYEVASIKVDMILVDQDMRVRRSVNVMDKQECGNIIEFSQVYPYTPDYEYCTFHIFVILREKEGGSA